MANKELELYEIIDALANSAVPLMFKGALITKLVLSENGYKGIERGTRDIDANWIYGDPDPQNIVDSITHALHENGLPYSAVLTRSYSEDVSEGIQIISDTTGLLITKMDIDVKPLASYSEYHYGDTVFYGASVDQVVSDKLNSISGAHIFRRVKDLVDIYALSECIKISSDSVYRTLARSERELGDFSVFLYKEKELAHAYSTLKGILNKPEFAPLYDRVKDFCAPFIEKEKGLIWEPDNYWMPDPNIRLRHSNSICLDDELER